MTMDQAPARPRFRDNFTAGERAMFQWGVTAGMAIILGLQILFRVLT